MQLKEIRDDEKPLSEQYRLAGEAWAEADGAASLLESLRSTTLEQRKSQLILDRGEMPDNKAERIVKSSPAWEEYIRTEIRLRMEANKLRVRMQTIQMEFSQWQSRDANTRADMRMSRG